MTEAQRTAILSEFEKRFADLIDEAETAGVGVNFTSCCCGGGMELLVDDQRVMVV